MNTNVKMIKFDLTLNGVKITNLEQLQEHFSADVLPIFQAGRLSKWLKSRDLLEQATAIEAIAKDGSELQQLKSICQVLVLDDEEDVLQFLLEDRQNSMVKPITPALGESEVETEEISNLPSASEKIDDENEKLAAEAKKLADFVGNLGVTVAKLSVGPLGWMGLTEANINDANNLSRMGLPSKLSLRNMLKEHRDWLCDDNKGMAANWFPVFCPGNEKKTAKLINRAIESYAHKLDDLSTYEGELILLHDRTVFIGGVEGFLITDKVIYWKYDGIQPSSIYLNDIVSIYCSDSSNSVLEINGQRVSQCLSDACSKKLKILAKCLVRYVSVENGLEVPDLSKAISWKMSSVKS